MAKAQKKQALGRGLSALLKDPDNDIQKIDDKNAKQIVGSVLELEKLSTIEINPFQPRTVFGEEQLLELASSIKELGVIQPITVRKLKFNKYQLISGERRFRACKHLGLDTIPAFVRIADDRESLEMALVENIQRQDLDPIEIALSYQRLIDEIKVTQQELSLRVGKKRATITNYLRLLKLNPTIQTAIKDGNMSMGHGRALINIDDKQKQLEIFQKVLSHEMSVRDTEELVRAYQEGSEEKKNKRQTQKDKKVPEYINQGHERIKQFFSSKVEVKLTNDKKKGKILIPFNSEEEFQKILDLLK